MRRLLAVLLCLGGGFIGQAHAAFGFNAYRMLDVGGWANRVAIGDVNGDERNDLVVARGPASGACGAPFDVLVFQQTIDGNLPSPLVVPTHSTDCVNTMALGDLNHDGVQDIVLGRDNGISLLTTSRARPKFKLTEIDSVARSQTALLVLDADRDGHQDILVQDYGSAPAIFYGDGMGRIAHQQFLPGALDGMATQSGDFNGDGLPDLMSWATLGALKLTLHDDTGGYSTTPLTFGADLDAFSRALGDFNNDGRLDVAVHAVGESADVLVFDQQASGMPFTVSHAYTLASTPDSLFATDLDGDGLDDLVVTHEGSDQIGYMLQGPSGLGAEQLLPALPGWLPLPVDSIADGDIDGDGCKDLVLGSYDVGVVVITSHGCTIPPDLEVSIAGNASTIHVGLVNRSTSASIAAPLVTLQLSVSAGTLASGTLPAQCVLQAQTTNTQRIECLVDTMAPQAALTLAIPVTIAGASLRTSLSARVRAETDTRELSLRNNTASLRIMPARAAATHARR
jgi:hypothetical protein